MFVQRLVQVERPVAVEITRPRFHPLQHRPARSMTHEIRLLLALEHRPTRLDERRMLPREPKPAIVVPAVNEQARLLLDAFVREDGARVPPPRRKYHLGEALPGGHGHVLLLEVGVEDAVLGEEDGVVAVDHPFEGDEGELFLVGEHEVAELGLLGVVARRGQREVGRHGRELREREHPLSHVGCILEESHMASIVKYA